MTDDTPIDPRPTARGGHGPSGASEAGGTDDAYECPHCGRLFARDQWLALHRGLEHDDRLTDEEREAYREAAAAETEALRLFRLKALAALVLLYFSFVMAYAVYA